MELKRGLSPEASKLYHQGQQDYLDGKPPLHDRGIYACGYGDEQDDVRFFTRAMRGKL